MHFDLLVRNGLVILEGGEVRTDIGVKDGSIAAIGPSLHTTGTARETVDAEGLIVSPGMVDVHVHITDPGGPRANWEGYPTATRACAKGGVTTVLEMPLNQIPATVDRATMRAKDAAGRGRLYVDVGTMGGVVPSNIENGGVRELDEEGVVGYKCFMIPCGDPRIKGDFAGVTDYYLLEGMREVARTGKVLMLHAENASITEELGRRARARGEAAVSQYVATRPVISEVEAIRRALLFAEHTGCRIHVAHVSCPEGVAEVVAARRRGVDATVETCLHYLCFCTEELDAIGPLAKCSPPIRGRGAQEGLWRQVLRGDVLTVVSDHSPCNRELKESPNAFDAWGGVSGVQCDVEVFFDEAVQKRGMPLRQFAALTAANPAERFNLPTKGSIAVGKDADLVLIRPRCPHQLRAEDLEYQNKISAYVGRTIGAKVSRTYLRGSLIYNENRGVGDTPLGEFLRPSLKRPCVSKL